MSVTVRHAIQRGARIVTLPSFLIVLLMGIGILVVLGLSNNSRNWLGMGIGVGLYLLIGIIVSGLLQTKWRIWAFTNVADIHDLERKAIKAKLLYPRGYWLRRLVIASPGDKLKLDEIDRRLEVPDLFQEVFIDDTDVPETTVVYYSKGGNLFNLLLFLFLSIGALAAADSTKNYVIMGVLLLFFLWQSWKSYEQLMNRDSQIIVGENGIQFQEGPLYPWDRIRNEKIMEEGRKILRFYLFYQYRDEYEEEFNGESQILLEGYDISADRLEYLLEIYRKRHDIATSEVKGEMRGNGGAVNRPSTLIS